MDWLTDGLFWGIAGVTTAMLPFVYNYLKKRRELKQSKLFEKDHDREEIFAFTRDQRLLLFERWNTLEPEYSIPIYSVATDEIQISLQESNPIDLDPINKLLTFLNLERFVLKLPLSQGEYEKIKNSKDHVCGLLSERIPRILSGVIDVKPFSSRRPSSLPGAPSIHRSKARC